MQVMGTTRRFAMALVNPDCNTRWESSRARAYGHRALPHCPPNPLQVTRWPTTKPAAPGTGTQSRRSQRPCASARAILLSDGFVARRHAYRLEFPLRGVARAPLIVIIGGPRRAMRNGCLSSGPLVSPSQPDTGFPHCPTRRLR